MSGSSPSRILPVERPARSVRTRSWTSPPRAMSSTVFGVRGRKCPFKIWSSQCPFSAHQGGGGAAWGRGIITRETKENSFGSDPRPWPCKARTYGGHVPCSHEENRMRMFFQKSSMVNPPLVTTAGRVIELRSAFLSRLSSSRIALFRSSLVSLLNTANSALHPLPPPPPSPRLPPSGYRGTSLTRKTHSPRISIGPQAQGYCRVSRGGGGL